MKTASVAIHTYHFVQGLAIVIASLANRSFRDDDRKAMKDNGLMLALDDFVHTSTPMVRKLARERLHKYAGWFKDPEGEYDDLVQVGMLRLVIIYPKIDFTHQGYKSFVYQSVKGVITNYIVKTIPHIVSRQQFLKVVSLESAYDDAKEVYCDDYDLEAHLILVLFQQAILEAMSRFLYRLSPRERFIVMAKFLEGKSYQEIGDQLGHSRKRIAKHLHRILAELLQVVKHQHGWTLRIDDLEAYLKNADLHPLVVS